MFGLYGLFDLLEKYIHWDLCWENLTVFDANDCILFIVSCSKVSVVEALLPLQKIIRSSANKISFYR